MGYVVVVLSVLLAAAVVVIVSIHAGAWKWSLPMLSPSFTKRNEQTAAYIVGSAVSLGLEMEEGAEDYVQTGLWGSNIERARQIIWDLQTLELLESARIPIERLIATFEREYSNAGLEIVVNYKNGGLEFKMPPWQVQVITGADGQVGQQMSVKGLPGVLKFIRERRSAKCTFLVTHPNGRQAHVVDDGAAEVLASLSELAKEEGEEETAA